MVPWVPAAVIEGPSLVCCLITAGMGSLRQASRPVLDLPCADLPHLQVLFPKDLCSELYTKPPSLYPGTAARFCSAVGPVGLVNTALRHSCCAHTHQQQSWLQQISN